MKTAMKREEKTTLQEYTGFQVAFDFFNEELFNGSLPQLLIVLTSDAKAKRRGHYCHDKFESRIGNAKVPELALYPNTFGDRTDEEILSTLVHEMVHCQQNHGGKPGRRGYHNVEWGRMMKAVGLHPSDTGEAGGKESGERVSHYIVEGGLYQQAYRKLAITGLKLHWQSGMAGKGGVGKPKPPSSKIKYTCTCGLRAWAKPGVSLMCAECEELMEETA
jgi:predicted SprT family Zn-dependent metalloprotease